MSGKTPSILLLILLTTFFPARSTTAAEQPPLRIAYPNFPPFHSLRTDGRVEGIFYDILVEALDKRMGLRLIWTPYPWTRCQENLKTGQDDAIMTVPTAERSVYTTTHKQPFFGKPLHLFTSADHPRLTEIMQIKTLADIKNLDLSIITYSGNGWHNDHVRSMNIKTYETPHLGSVWLMLAEHRGDMVIEWPLAAEPELQHLNIQNRIVDTGIILAKMPFFLLIRKDSVHAPLLDRFDATIEQMSADGAISTILKRYQ